MPTPIDSAAAYVPSRAVAFPDVDGSSLLVSNDLPLPVRSLAGARRTACRQRQRFGGRRPVHACVGSAGRAGAVGRLGGYGTPAAFNRRGATKLPVTVGGAVWAQFTGNACEPVWEESDDAARLYLDIVLSAGTLTYRLTQ